MLSSLFIVNSLCEYDNCLPVTSFCLICRLELCGNLLLVGLSAKLRSYLYSLSRCKLSTVLVGIPYSTKRMQADAHAHYLEQNQVPECSFSRTRLEFVRFYKLCESCQGFPS